MQDLGALTCQGPPIARWCRRAVPGAPAAPPYGRLSISQPLRNRQLCATGPVICTEEHRCYRVPGHMPNQHHWVQLNAGRRETPLFKSGCLPEGVELR